MNPEAGYSCQSKSKRTGLYPASADFGASACATIHSPVANGQGRLARAWSVLCPDNSEDLIEQKVGGTILAADDYSSGMMCINLDNLQGATTDVREVESVTGISATAEAAMEYKGFSASLSTTVSHQLRTRVATESTQVSSTTVTVEREYLANGKRPAQSLWFRADRYVPERTDGSRVMEWQTTTDQDTVDSVYPPATG
ncbi:hypothetical protein ACFW2Y_32700 [Streptomyces sp. NPDC058877]|uniref:hypothetical protein n=1 Tax=unclassified Streptomyces TaxID=2593676 RepID=UPI0036B94C96